MINCSSRHSTGKQYSHDAGTVAKNKLGIYINGHMIEMAFEAIFASLLE